MRKWKTTAAGFEPARAEPIGFQVQHLNHSVTLSAHTSVYDNEEPAPMRAEPIVSTMKL